MLSNSERSRYEAFLRPERRRQFLAGRVLLRHMLSAELDRPVDAWRFEERPGLPPRLLTDIPRPVAFSLAHSHDLAVCLVVPGGAAGADVEFLGKDRDHMAIAARCFCPEQIRRLAALPRGQQRILFYRYWTLNEAVVKVGSCGDAERTSCRGESAGNRGLVLVTTVFGDYAIAAAIGGGFPVPATIGRLRSDGSVEECAPRPWHRHGMEDVGFAKAEFSREPVTGSS